MSKQILRNTQPLDRNQVPYLNAPNVSRGCAGLTRATLTTAYAGRLRKGAYAGGLRGACAKRPMIAYAELTSSLRGWLTQQAYARGLREGSFSYFARSLRGGAAVSDGAQLSTTILVEKRFGFKRVRLIIYSDEVRFTLLLTVSERCVPQ